MPAARGELAAQGEGLASCTHPEPDYVLTRPASCFGRELAACPPGSEAFFDDCGCGCGEAPDYSRSCRSPGTSWRGNLSCRLAGGIDCPSSSFEAMPNYDATLAQWSALVNREGLVAGECSNGRRFIMVANGLGSEARIFASEGLFLGVSTTSDTGTSPCWGQGYWPEPVSCAQATITLIANPGTFPAVGEVIPLPWAEGPPESL
jgi:hypothetical protein